MAKQCACKGIRRCLLCEDQDITLSLPQEAVSRKDDVWLYCSQCQNRAYRHGIGHEQHTNSEDFILVKGVHLMTEFLSVQEELTLCDNIDKIPWIDSQSGRRKQDFGPKVNFKKKKIRLNTFKGFPAFARFILERMRSIDILSSFIAVEMCNLEYVCSRGSAIDPHFDDFWLWGERLVTINLLSETSYTLSQTGSNTKIIVSLPRRCICVLSDEARYKWMHAIDREHIASRRLAINIRELTNEFLEGGESWAIGKELIEVSRIDVEY